MDKNPAKTPPRPSSSASPRLVEDELAKAKMQAAEIAFYLKDEFDDDSCTLASFNTEVSKVSLSTAGSKKPGAYWTLNSSQVIKPVAKPKMASIPQEESPSRAVVSTPRSSAKKSARLAAPQPVQLQEDNDDTSIRSGRSNRRATITQAKRTCQKVEQILNGAFDALDPNLVASRTVYEQEAKGKSNDIEDVKVEAASLVDDESCTSTVILAQTPTELEKGLEVNRTPRAPSTPGALRIRGLSSSLQHQHEQTQEEEDDNLVVGDSDDDDDSNALDRILEVDDEEWDRLDQPNTLKIKPIHNVVVAAELAEDVEASLQDQVRQSILQETPKAEIVHVEHSSSCNSIHAFEDPISYAVRKAQLERYRPRGVKEKLFGDGKSGTLDIGASPDDYIRKRDHLPFTVKQNDTTNLWVASVQTNQKAWEDTRGGSISSSSSPSLDLVRSVQTFSAMTQDEAYETGLAMAPPVMEPFEENPICYCCKTKFAVFRRPNHCRNCGVVVCASCSCSWSNKRFPSTYPTHKKPNALVCLACDWLSSKFKDALLKGNLEKVKKLYKTGNVNLRHPFGPWKKGGAGPEIMNPIHMAIIGGNLDLVRWLMNEKCCPLRRRDKDRSILITSKGRTPIQLALTQSNPEILRFLVVEKGLSLMREDLRGDYRHLLVHLTSLLKTVPESMLHQLDDDESEKSSSSFEFLNTSLPNFGRSITLQEKAVMMNDRRARRGSF